MRIVVAPFAVIIITTTFATAVSAEVINCRLITDSLERLRCYDAQAEQPAAVPIPSPPRPATAPTEDPLITKAKGLLKRQLRDPDSARFQQIKIKTVEGKKGLCGQVNAKNAMGGMTGFIPFAYDGEYVTILSFNAGAGNPTSFGPDILDVTLGRRLKAHETWCK